MAFADSPCTATDLSRVAQTIHQSSAGKLISTEAGAIYTASDTVLANISECKSDGSYWVDFKALANLVCNYDKSWSATKISGCVVGQGTNKVYYTPAGRAGCGAGDSFPRIYCVAK